MKSYQLTAQTGLDGLARNKVPEPKAGPGQVVVHVRATSLNYRDLMIATGMYGGPLPLPLIPLSDGAGEVVEVGSGVSDWKTGDRVCGTFFQNWKCGPLRREAFNSALGGSASGMLAEYVTLSADGVVAFPEHLSYEEAATLPCAGLTAWNALCSASSVTAGQTVLLLGTGGVSMFGLQFARMHGARTIVTSSSDEKLARARELGADATVNYRTTADWEQEVYRLTGEAGADHILEVGGKDTFQKSLRALALGGTISVIGGVSGFTADIAIGEILMRNANIRGIYVGSREMFEEMNRAITQHKLKPAIGRVFAFDEAVEAYRYLQSGEHFGKVVVGV